MHVYSWKALSVGVIPVAKLAYNKFQVHATGVDFEF
jgi:hypothetical protein